MLQQPKPSVLLIVDTNKTKEESKLIINQLGYTKGVMVDSRGYSRGLWLLWNEDVEDVEGEVTTPWSIYAIITLKSRPER